MTRTFRSGALAALALSLCACRSAPAAPTFAALVVRQDLPAGELLTDEMLEARQLPVDPAAGDVLATSAFNQVSGRRLKVAVHAGAPLRARDLDTTGRLSSIVQKKGRAVTLPVAGADWLEATDHVDVLANVADPQTQETMTLTVLQNVVLLKLGPTSPPAENGQRTRPVTFLVMPEEAEMLLQASRSGSIFVTGRNPEDVDIQEERGRATLMTLLVSERGNTLMRKRLQTVQAH